MRQFLQSLTLDRKQQRVVIAFMLLLTGFAAAKSYRAERRAPAVNQSSPGSRP